MTRARVLVIAGLDPSGRAGLLADVEAVRALGAEPHGCATAATAQPMGGEVQVFPLQADALGAQIDAVLAEGPVQAVKLGMLASAELARVVIDQLTRISPGPTVIDPVLATTTGAPLFAGGSPRDAYRALARLGPIFTPNLPELGILSGGGMSADGAEAVRQAEVLLGWGASAVLVKGGHRTGDVRDLLVTSDGKRQVFPGERVETVARGKGCRLASAMAACLAQGADLISAIERARERVHRHLLAHPRT